MKTSWCLGRVAGIGIRVHVTFPLLALWIAAVHLRDGWAWPAFAADLGLAAAVFAFVVLHELGHALMARRFGIATRDITLLPIGGVAHLERMPERPAQELAVALAGPAVNVGLAGLLALGRALWPGGPAVIGQLMWLNVAMATFNLLPAFPMDGGRVLRALLALRLDLVRATNLAAAIGQLLAFALGAVGLFVNPFLTLVALFIWMGAGEEARTIRIRAALAAVPVGRICVTRFETLPPRLTLREAAECMQASYQPVFPVVADGELRGLLGRERLLEALAARGGAARVEEVMAPGPEPVDAARPFAEVVARLGAEPAGVWPVRADGRLVGLLGAGSIGEYVRFHDALAAGGAGAREIAAPGRPGATGAT
jgi:Zn-dependent protease/CBS domain-containing protein